MNSPFWTRAAAVVLISVAATACNTVTKEQLEKVKVGDILVYRYRKAGKSWFYKEKVVRIEGDTYVVNPSKKEGTSKNIVPNDFAPVEKKIAKADLLKLAVESGTDRTVVIEIR